MRGVLQFVLFVALTVLPGAAFAQATTFTYQGQLKLDGQLVNGEVDLRFRMYDLALEGVQLGSQMCFNDITVSDGRFTVALDFGDNFNGATRYLEIDTRDAAVGNCTTSAGFTTLGPRQAITAAPFASYAAKAGDAQLFGGFDPLSYRNASNLVTGILPASLLPSVAARTNASNTFTQPNTFTGGVTINSFVGINRSSPVSGADVLHLGNAAGQTGYVGMYISTDAPGGIPFYGYAFSGAAAWTEYDSSLTWGVNNFGRRLSVLSNGRVGIGTPSPSTLLDVRGDIAMGTNGSLFALAGTEKTLSLRGRILQNGGVFFGSGFTCARIGTGFYRITFNTAFASAPTVTANAVGVSARIVSIGGTSTTTADIYVFNASGAATDADVMVHISGPR
ncbi:MAG TPA: hypothetical protein VK157_09445 [Phycisphaerales bacterium]|nr:hypothetical protein [Phycisphaerales bacterium]